MARLSWALWLPAAAAFFGLYVWEGGRRRHLRQQSPVGWSLWQDVAFVRESGDVKADAPVGQGDAALFVVKSRSSFLPRPNEDDEDEAAENGRRGVVEDLVEKVVPSPLPAGQVVPLLSQGSSLQELSPNRSQVADRLALATLLPNFDEEAYRMLASVRAYEANSTIFVSCTEEVGNLLPKLFPTLRFVLFPWLDLAGPIKTNGALTSPAVRKFGNWSDYDKKKSDILKTAFEHGALSVWYIESDIVLFEKLPVVDPTLQVATSEQRAAKEKRQVSSPGLMYFASQSALLGYERDRRAADLGCSHSVGWYEMDPDYSVGGLDRFGDLVCQSSPELRFNDCRVASLQLREWKATRRLLPSLLTALKQCNHPLTSLFQMADQGLRGNLNRPDLFEPYQNQVRRSPVDQSYLPPGPCGGSWCQPDSTAKVMYRRSLLELTNPAAHVRGGVAICVLIWDLLDSQVHRFLRSISTFAASTTIFVSCSPDGARRLAILYPTLRFVFQPILGKYLDEKTGLLLSREKLKELNLWSSFLLEGPFLVRTALKSGARASWLLDARLVLLAELPVFDDTVKIALSTSPLDGSFDSGNVYFGSSEKVELWLDALRGETDEAHLGVFQHDPDAKVIGCGASVGRSSSPADLLAADFTCVRATRPDEGQVFWKGCPISSLHAATRGLELRMLAPLTKALGECQHRALSIFQWAPPTVLFQRRVLESYDERANVVDHVVLATTIASIDQQAHRLLQSIQAFEANATLFVSCQMAVADDLSALYPSLRFSFHAQLDKYHLHYPHKLPIMPASEQLVQEGVRAGLSMEKATLLRIALASGARSVWYISPELVLTNPLTPVEPETEVAYSLDAPDSPAGIMYFRSEKFLKLWLDATTTYLFKQGAFEEGHREKTVGIASTSVDFASDTLRMAFPHEHFVLQCGHAVDFNTAGGTDCSAVQCKDNVLVVSDCPLRSARFRNGTASCLEAAQNSCSLAATHRLQGLVGDPKVEPPPELEREDVMRTFNTPGEGVQEVTYWHKNINMMDPAANVVGKVVFGIITHTIADEAVRLIRSLQIFEADTTVFVSCTQEVADELPTKFPNIRLAIFPRLDKYRPHRGWKWPGRHGMEMMKGAVWPNFNLEKAFLARLALTAGARGVWYGDTDTYQVGPLQQHPFSVKAGLSPHRVVASKIAEYGYINSGAIYFSSIPMAEKWIDGTFNCNAEISFRDSKTIEATRTQTRTKPQDQVSLSELRFDPDAVENDCGVDVGGWQLREGDNLFGERANSMIRCENGQIIFKSCVVSSFHLHITDEPQPLEPFIQRAIEECDHPALELMPKGSLPYPPSPPDFVEPVSINNNKTRIALSDPSSGIPGNVVVCVVLTQNGLDLKRLLDSLSKKEDSKTVIAAISEDAAEKLPSKARSLKFAFWCRMNKFRHPVTGLWPTTAQMQETGQWPAYRQLKFDLMRTAFDNGATGVWFLGMGVELRAHLPQLPPGIKFGLLRHRNFEGTSITEGSTGIFDEGVMYVADKESLQRLEELAKTPSNYDSLAGRPELQEFECPHGSPPVKCGMFTLFPLYWE